MNVQLSAREAVTVYVEQDSNRVLGFTPEKAKPLFPSGIRYKSYTLLHASEIERWVKRYREQQDRDAYEATLLRVQRESRFRSALKSAIRERNQHVSPMNRALNETFVRLMDEKYERMIKAMLHPVVHGVAEAYEAGACAYDVALDSPYFKHGPERVAGGGAVEDDK